MIGFEMKPTVRTASDPLRRRRSGVQVYRLYDLGLTALRDEPRVLADSFPRP
jgi:hypothetical protein